MILDKDSLRSAFEKYMLAFYQEEGRFHLNDFADFAITWLNYQVNARLLKPKDKKEAAYYLVTLYNKGMGNRIVEDDLQAITDFICKDYSVDFQILQRIND